MNTELSSFQSIIVRRNLRALIIASTSSKSLDDSGESDHDEFSTPLYSTSDFYSAHTAEGSPYNPSESPSPDLPPLPHSHSSSPVTQINDAQQELLDILTANIPSEPPRDRTVLSESV